MIVALMVAGAPLALAACEMACAVRGIQPKTTAHACHDAQDAKTTAVSSVHLCGHTGDLPASSAKLSPQGAPAPTIAAAVSTPSANLEQAPLRLLAATPSPPVPLKRTSQLRI